MPNYTLKCRHCGKEFTVLTSFTNLKRETCPQCKSSDLERVYSGKTFAVSANSKGCG